MSIKKIKDAIEKNKKFLITSHINLEGDAIGCQLAMYSLIKSFGKKATILDEDHPPSLYNFIPNIKKINTDLSKKPSYDVAIVLDCPTIERTGNVENFIDKNKTIINIDHHVSNRYYGDINWVDHKASSCGQMVYELFRAFGKTVKKEVAIALYVAILTDTGSFGYENTAASTHLVAKELIEKGIKPVDIHNLIYESKSFSEIKLLQDALSTLKLVHDGRIVYLYVTRKMLLDAGCEPRVTEGFINYARSIQGPKVSMLFSEDPYEENTVQVGFRAKGEANVDELAAHFGGGGHKNAAGCILKGSLNQVINKVLKVIKAKI